MTRIRILLALALILVAGVLHTAGAAHVTAQAAFTPTRTFPPTNTPRPTRTPTIALQATSVPVSGPIPGALCLDCNRLRMRATPGTAGAILAVLNDSATFDIVGRTADSQWLEITLSDSQRGWIAARFARNRDRSLLDPARVTQLEVRGVAVEASPTPTSAFLAGVPGWLTGVSSNARNIYLRGQQMGNNRSAFSKVGDSITASGEFLYPFASGNYNLGSYGGASGALGFFGGSFGRESRAAAPGWTANQLLDSNKFADCGGDTPLVCEYKRQRPAVALIMIGTNDSGSGSAEVFAGQLREIVQITIDMGIVPVLSTIPPKVFDEEQTRRVEAFNSVIVATARQFDIPLWDYHANMAGLPNQGISSDGLHPSVSPYGSGVLTAEGLQYGYTLRNRDALLVLDSLIRTVMY